MKSSNLKKSDSFSDFLSILIPLLFGIGPIFFGSADAFAKLFPGLPSSFRLLFIFVGSSFILIAVVRFWYFVSSRFPKS